MSFLAGPLETLARDAIFSVHGVPATVTRPGPYQDAIATRVVWMTPDPFDRPASLGKVRRQEPQRIAVLRRDAVDAVPKGTRITAPELAGGATKVWIVDGLEREQADVIRAFVIEDAQACATE